MMTAIRAFLLLSASLIVGGVTGAQVRSPALTIVSPQEAAFVAGRTPLRARVEPAGEAISVIFYVDGLQICALSRPPFECEWDAGVQVVEHQVRAVATFTGARHVVGNVRTQGLDYAESVDVRSVQLTATVSDNRGHFVKGLPRSSFPAHRVRFRRWVASPPTSASSSSKPCARRSTASTSPVCPSGSGC